MASRPKKGYLRLILINLGVLLAIVVAIEVAALIGIWLVRGDATAGKSQRFKYLTYQPFVMFGPDWDRITERWKQILVHERPDATRVLLLGGSTAANFPRAVLEASLERAYPGKRFMLINFAYGGYNARQELVQAALWGTRLNPHLMVTLDGANDFNHRLRTNTPRAFLSHPDYDLALKQPFLGLLAHVARHSQALAAVRRIMARRRLGPPEEYTDAISTYIDAQRGINSTARGVSADRLMVLQPYMPFKNPLSPQEKDFTWYKYREPVVKTLYESARRELAVAAASDRVLFLDATPIYNGVAETVFSDDVHFVDSRGYELLADAMVKTLRDAKWRPPPTYERRFFGAAPSPIVGQALPAQRPPRTNQGSHVR